MQEQSAAPTPGKESYSYESPYPVYAIDWSSSPGSFRLGFGSFIEEYKNHISVISLQNDSLTHVATADVNYPVTKLMWAPASAANQNILATTGDYLRLWDLKQETDHLPKLSCKSTLANIRRGPHKKDYCAPLTSFDWNETDPSLCVTSSIDTTCTVWNVETGQAKTQLIAHDKEVFDVAFAKGTDVFASVGADGSVRMFDLRSLEHSTIIYETSAAAKALTTPAGGPAGVDTNIQTALQSPHEQSPLLRLAWNKQDPNYLATFQLNSKSVLILDIRVPATPVCTLTGHGGVVNAVAWAPHSAGHLVSVGDDHQALVWDVEGARVRGEGEPVLAYNAGGEINQVSWNAMLSDWIGISTGNFISVLKV